MTRDDTRPTTGVGPVVPPPDPGSAGLGGHGGTGVGGRHRRGDTVFRTASSGAGIFVLVLIVAIGVFLVGQALDALGANRASFLTSRDFSPNGDAPRFGVLALTYGTLVTSVLAVVLAVPVAVGVALYVTQYAPPRVARPVGYLVDLLAAVPSVVYGLWGIFFLGPRMRGLQAFLADRFGFVPLFDAGRNGNISRSLLLAGIILAIMILPIVAAICREVFVQVPAANREAALALGATRLEMIRMAVLPYSRAGVVSAVMLGLGRALGETIAVALVLSAVNTVSVDLLGNGNTIAANIANSFGEATPTGRGALIATGLVLFVITMVVNLVARGIVYRSSRLDTRGSA